MRVRLVALDGTGDIPILGLLTIVGRQRDCNAHLASARVTRRHCCLALGDDGVLVRDLGSTNGVSINHVRVGEGLIRPGDILSIAHLRFRLLILPPPETDGTGELSTQPDSDPATPLETEPEMMPASPRAESTSQPDPCIDAS
jgi:pSer/pThr/pTyr-binding forkhead associated (FHA) protein